MKNAMRTLAISACLLISGCKLDLYTGLSEQNANEMLALLMTNGISASTSHNGDNGVTLLIEEGDLTRAIDILKQNGLPKTETDSMGKVFAKSGIISSPFEERIRYIYALGEDVAKTLNEIDGVLVARVHVVLPEVPEHGADPISASAAVFIKHRRGVDLDFFTPQIRRLVSNAIEGVDYENVTVVSVEAELPPVMADQGRGAVTEVLPGLGVRAGDVQYFWSVMAASMFILALLVFSNLATFFAFAKARTARNRMKASDKFQTNLGE